MSESPKVLRAGDGDVLGSVLGCTDRFMIEGHQTHGRFALVEHTLAPRALAAPMHRHSKEDEFSFVRAGTLAAIFDGTEVVAGPGDLVFKPRGQWHTFWNPGDEPTRVLEIISPAGLEQFFRLVDAPEAEQDLEKITEMSASVGCDVDQDATAALVRRHGLTF